MNRGMRVLWFFPAILAVLSLSATVLAADSAKRYALAKHGVLKLDVPAGWIDKLDQKSRPPLLTFRQSQGQPFVVSLTALPKKGAAGKTLSKEALRGAVEKLAGAIRPFAVEKEIKLTELAGSAGTGFYFLATDAAPASGDYKFMTRGMLKVGDLAVTFTILTNDGQDEIIRAALEMLKSAAQVTKSP